MPRSPAIRGYPSEDITRADPIEDIAEMERRSRLLTDWLGSKLRPACAVVVPPRLTQISEKFLSLRAGLTLN